MLRFILFLVHAGFLPLMVATALPAHCQEEKKVKPILLKAATNNPKISGQYQGMLIFKKLVEERTGGRVLVEIFSDGVLGDEEQLAEKMQSGHVDFTIHSSAKYANFVPEVDIYSPPYTFRNWSHMKAVVASQVQDKLVRSVLERRGDYLVGVFTEGVRNVFSRTQISTLAEMQYLRIRTMTGPSEVTAWRALGASPIPTAYLDLHQALQTGAVDGAENTMTSILGMKFYESTRYVLRTAHNHMAMFGILSGKFVKKLPREVAEIVIQAAGDAAREQLDWAIAFDRENEITLKGKHGVKVSELSRRDHEKARKICEVIQAENARRIRMERELKLIFELGKNSELPREG